MLLQITTMFEQTNMKAIAISEKYKKLQQYTEMFRTVQKVVESVSKLQKCVQHVLKSCSIM